MDRATADAQPFGVVKLSDDGVIQLYNKWERRDGDLRAGFGRR